MGAFSALLSNLPNQTLHSGDDLNPVIWHASGIIPNAIDFDYPEGYIVEASPGEFSGITIPIDGYYRARTRVRWFNNTAPATVSIDLLLNGGSIANYTVPIPFTGEGDPPFLTNPSWPLADFYHAGDVFSTRFHNVSQGDNPLTGATGYVDPGSARSESFNLLTVEGFQAEGIPEEEICSDILSIESIDPCGLTGFRVVRTYASDGTPGLVYSLAGNGEDLSPDSSANLFVVENNSDPGLSSWVADGIYCVCNSSLILVDTNKVFYVKSTTGYTDFTIGKSGHTEPTWPGSGTVVDNDLTWTFVGPDDGSVFDTWIADSTYSVGGTFVLASDGNIYEVTSSSGVTNPNCGQAGSSEPTWPSSGDVTDGAVTWSFAFLYSGPSDPHTFIEKFDNSGVSSGEFGPDHQLVLGLDATQPLAVCTGPDDTVWFLGWKTDPGKLCLFHLDIDGTLLGSWDDLEFGITGQPLSMDVSQTDVVYYTQVGETLIRSYTSGSQGAFSINADDFYERFNGKFGAIKLFITDTQPSTQRGGIALAKGIDVTDEGFEFDIVEFTCGGAGKGRVPITANENAQTILCWGEQTNLVWTYADDTNLKLRKIDLNTGGSLLVIDLVTGSIRINSCTALKGVGFVCKRRRTGFTAVTG